MQWQLQNIPRFSYVSFHGILVADELICDNFWTNDAILLKLHHLFKSYDKSAHQPQ